ncbi:uncharacterized protein LOC142169841 [Nicotiana tabacum]|uniref:Uncharacterized protein LOC142169841 n=1 Tax=Nicotiana tabacum TaxID=4097 RepID=A0AC58SSB2_TOBAC
MTSQLDALTLCQDLYSGQVKGTVCPRIVDKFSPRAILVVFLGYSSSQKGYVGYVLYDFNSKSLFVNKNIVFQEDIFPFKHMLSPGSTIFPILDLLSPISADPRLSATDSSLGADVLPHEADVISEGEPHLSHVDSPHHTPDFSTSPTNPACDLPDNVAPVDTHVEGHLDSIEVVDAAAGINSLGVVPAQVLSPYSACFEPQSFSEATTNPQWVEAMKLEIVALEENKTWSIVGLPTGKTPIGYRWIFKIKYKALGQVERYKVRLVAKGYSQKEGMDYSETFFPVAKMVAVRSIVALAAS